MNFGEQDRDAYLRAQLSRSESIVALGPPALVTDRRVLFAWRLNWPPHAGEWAHDGLTFDEVTRWSQGHRHDDRPVLRLEHPPHRRLEWVPAHRVMGFRWGNATGTVEHRATEFAFRGRRDPVYLAMREGLGRSRAVPGAPFREVLPGTRESRLGQGTAVLVYRPGRLGRLRGRLARLDHDLHHGSITWWIRVTSWLLLAVPAWFVNPWLVLPAVGVVEVAWVIGLQWSWRRAQHPQVGAPTSAHAPE
jgi:hypothetical protein